MKRFVIDYSNSKIYCIRSHQFDKIYIGSTTQSLSLRMAKHRSHYKNYMRTHKYVSSIELLKYPDAYIELIEKVDCKNIDELMKIEGGHIRANIDKCVNKNISGRTVKEYKLDNIEKIRAYNKDYNKKYAEANDEKIKAYMKKYRADNAERCKRLRMEEIACGNCGTIKKRQSMYSHLKQCVAT